MTKSDKFFKGMALLADKMLADAKANEAVYERLRVNCPHRKSCVQKNYRGRIHSKDFECRQATKHPENRKQNLYYCRLCNCQLLP